ncbi:PKD domain-containing protein, partial [Nanoarchaeota archaeon]
EYVVEFETEAPEKTEGEPVETEEGWKKEVTISSDEEYEGEYEYKNVLSYTDIKESEMDTIRLYWKVDGEMVDVTDDESFDIQFYDTNGNGLVDRISWITPHLSTQEFEVVITLTTSTGAGLDISLIEPDGEDYMSSSDIDFRFVVSYNRSLDVWCNLTIDDEVKETIAVLDGQETIVNKDINFSEGSHDWYIRCIDETDNTAQSSSNSFVVDLTPPAIVLHNDDPGLSLMDSITLNFTATDNLASTLDCEVSLDSQVEETTSASSGILESVVIDNLDNGTYQWDVTCSDEAGNSNTSISKTIHVDSQRNFSIIANKDNYDLGEGGVYWVVAPYGAEVSLVITNPNSNTMVRSYTDTFPVIDEIDFTDYPGTYTIEGFMNFNDAIKTQSISFSVGNTFSTSMSLSDNKVTPSEKIKFTARSSGGIGDVTYSWDFDDASSTRTGRELNYSYSETGKYNVKLTATDSSGNQAFTNTNVKVEEKYAVSVTVTEEGTNNPINKARVYLEGNEEITGSSGKVDYNVFKGEYTLFVNHDSYHYLINETDIEGDTAINVQLRKLGNNETQSDDIIYDIEEASTSNINQELTTTETSPVEIKVDADTEELITSTEDALESLDYMDSSDKDLASALGLRDSLERAVNFLRRVDRDLHNLEENRRDLSEEEIEEEKAKLEEEIERTIRETIISIDLAESDEFVKYPTPKEIEEVSSEYLKSKNISLTDKESDYFLKSNLEVQSSITVGTKISIATIKFLSGKEQKIALVINDLKSGGELFDTSFVVSIPKDIAESIDEIKVLTEHKVVNPDPVIEFDLAEIEEVIYYIEDDIDLEKIKEIKSVLILDPEKLEYKGSGLGIIGFAIFSKMSDIDNPMVVLEVLLIIILLGVYLAFQFDLVDKFKRDMLFRDKELQQIKGHIHDLDVCLENKELGNASVVYDDIMKEYKKISKEAKSKVHQETVKLYNKILFAQIKESIDKTLDDLKGKKVKEAKSNYEAIKGIYKQLPKEYKAEIGDKCRSIFDKIAALG